MIAKYSALVSAVASVMAWVLDDAIYSLDLAISVGSCKYFVIVRKRKVALNFAELDQQFHCCQNI